jgi:glycosyltransferase involved in cell wall biosynthesis
LTVARRPFFQAADVIISPTQWLLDQHRRRGFSFYPPTKTVVLPNPAPHYSLLVTHYVHNPIRLLFVGGVSKAKGSSFLTELVKAMTIPFELEVVGEGSELGVLDSNQVLEKMKQADILLVPSVIEENQPTVILEAASVGLPVVASDKAGIIETLAGAGRALPLHVDVWKKEMEQLAQEPDRYAALVDGMYALAHQHDPNHYRQRLVEVVMSNR